MYYDMCTLMIEIYIIAKYVPYFFNVRGRTDNNNVPKNSFCRNYKTF